MTNAEVNHIEVARTELPALTGSPKQIAWANDIRKQCIDEVNEWLQFAANVTSIHMDAARQKFAEIIQTKTDAKWWIDNRQASAAYHDKYGHDGGFVHRLLGVDVTIKCRRKDSTVNGYTDWRPAPEFGEKIIRLEPDLIDGHPAGRQSEVHQRFEQSVRAKLPPRTTTTVVADGMDADGNVLFTVRVV